MHWREPISIGNWGGDFDLCANVRRLLVTITIRCKGYFSLYSFYSGEKFFKFFCMELRFERGGFEIETGYEERIFDGFFVSLLDIGLTCKFGWVGFDKIKSFFGLWFFILNIIGTGDFFWSFRLHSYLNILYFYLSHYQFYFSLQIKPPL